MKGSQMLDCPGCAGPAALGGGCATCHGTTKVTQEAHDSFMASKLALDLLVELSQKIIRVTSEATDVESLKSQLAELIN
jgi:hypothetical protein